jgi:hypothetical protein
MAEKRRIKIVCRQRITANKRKIFDFPKSRKVGISFIRKALGDIAV